MHLLGCLLTFFLIIFYLALFAGARLWWSIRNAWKQMGMGGQDSSEFNNDSSNQRTTHSSTQKPSQKKVFADNEGEYVDFEEVR